MIDSPGNTYIKTLEIKKKAKYEKMKVLRYEQNVPYPITFLGITLGVLIVDFKVYYVDRIEHIQVIRPIGFFKNMLFYLKKRFIKHKYNVELIEN